MNLRMFVGIAIVMIGAQAARAQVPFFFPNGTAYSPQVSIVTTGVENDMQAVVSSDMKHVTLNARPTNASLLALRQFSFQNPNVNGGLGNVGDPPPTNDGITPRHTSGGADSAVRNSPAEILARGKAQVSVLHKIGMTRVGKLNE